MHSEGYLKWFDKHGKPRPVHEEHAEDSKENPLSSRLKRVQASNWRMEGPGKLVADTDMGPLVQWIPHEYVCEGTDNNGHPILRKIKI